MLAHAMGMVLFFKQNPLSKKELFLKLAVPKKLVRCLKTVCEKFCFYCICIIGLKLYLKNSLYIIKFQEHLFLGTLPSGCFNLYTSECYTKKIKENPKIINTAPKMKVFMKDFFSKRNCGFDHILLNESLESFTNCQINSL